VFFRINYHVLDNVEHNIGNNMSRIFQFNSQVQLGNKVADYTQEEVKNEPMLFSCDLKAAYNLGGKITRAFLKNLPQEFYYDERLIIDSRVAMLQKGWYPSIPGFHVDDVPREREDKQPNHINPSYRARHCMLLVGDCSLTRFALGEGQLEEPDLGTVIYGDWHPKVVDMVNKGELKEYTAPEKQLIMFDWQTFHEATAATKNGFRIFLRATIDSNRPHVNERRINCNVYLPNPMEGW
jgi:hypothetical protein